MKHTVLERQRWFIVALFAVGMAWVESATVYYLRAMVGRLEPYQPDPLPLVGTFGQVELVREAATLVMLLTVGMLAGRTWNKRLGYSAIAFGVWDIFYYVFLWIMCGWPNSLFDWDVLFLLPLPWWGPVIAPVGIALLMIVWGTFTTQFTSHVPATSLTRLTWAFCWAGIALALYVFMADAIHTVHLGIDVTRQVLPKSFNWTAYIVALSLMAAPVVQMGWAIRRAGFDLLRTAGTSA
jgi:hypothetical protein